ncbi:MAG: AraC family transcriptional regulator [Thermodesulfobacteriota bacterium]
MIEFTAAADYLRLVRHCAPEFRFDLDSISKRAGLDLFKLEQSGARIPGDQFQAAWNLLEAAHPDGAIGIYMGERTFSFAGHLLILILLNSPTIKAAIDNFCTYFYLLNDFTSPCLKVGRSLAELSIRLNAPELKPSRHISEAILTSYASVLNRISENTIPFEGVFFSHLRPDDITEHRRVFKAPLFFEQAENKLVFKRKYLALPITLSNREILTALEQLAQKLQEPSKVGRPWSHRVSQLIIKRLEDGESKIFPIAKNLGLSHRNLQKRLKREGVTYLRLLQEARKERALTLLRNQDYSLTEIALLLGYSEQSAFGRAFKQWAGCTPGKYRSRLG